MNWTRWSLVAHSALLLTACSSSTDPSYDLTGTFIGSYTATADPGVVYQGVLQITQNGNSLSGTLTTNAGRSASFQATVAGSRITGNLQFTDLCGGLANTTVDVTNGGDRLTGNYAAADCLGQYSGGYVLDRQ